MIQNLVLLRAPDLMVNSVRLVYYYVALVDTLTAMFYIYCKVLKKLTTLSHGPIRLGLELGRPLRIAILP